MSLNSISPIDGRYEKHTKNLAPYWSKFALMKYRIIVEGEYLIALSELKIKLRKFSDTEKKLIRSFYNLSEKDAQIISDIELKGYKHIKATDHDVKAIEYFMKDKLSKTSLNDSLEWIHFALTSEDTNNLAYALMLSDSFEQVLIPSIKKIILELNTLAKKHKNLAMLARTHGQPASPTTFGKEMKVFAHRLERGLDHLFGQKILAKLNGATGNYNAHIAAYPKINWPKFSEKFIANLTQKRIIPLELNHFTTQIESHDSYIEIFDRFKRLNNMLMDFNQDIWRYISDEWITQKPMEGVVGSSTMPHKVNPIKFENSEGNLGMANALFEFFGRKLQISRLQRDLSDSTVERNFGVAFSHCLIAYNYLLKGLSQISVNEKKIKESLSNHPEIITEAIQTILRREGVKMPYEKLKTLARGKVLTLKDIHEFINTLEVSEKIKKELLKITPENYIGLAVKLASK